MDQVLLHEAIKLNKERKRRKRWQKVFSIMAAVVVFCTTYALILPAITMENDPVCGVEEHEHGESCFEIRTEVQLACGIPEGVAHTHNEFCADGGGNLLCSLSEISQHMHDAGCYELISELGCTLEEIPAHSHEENCYQTHEIYVCGQEEVRAHLHGEGCFTPVQNLTCQQEEIQPHIHGEECSTVETATICGQEEEPEHIHSEDCLISVLVSCCTQEEREGHLHEDGCYTQGNQMTCLLQETEGHIHGEICVQTETELICTGEEGHTHGDNCFLVYEVLICEVEELEAHDHSQDCLSYSEPETVLICEKEIHIHGEGCYPQKETPAVDPAFLCGMGIHIHDEACQDEAGNLVCSIPEHIGHTAGCVVEGYDPYADLESQETWEATLAQVKLTGNWPTDVMNIAQSQLGYKESTRNLWLNENGTLTGYTRYGQWYGIPYGDWCAMFTSFCMHYAGVENVPLGAGCTTWIGELTEAGLYRSAGEYTPKPGDLIFFDWEYYEGAPLDSDHVGFVAEVIPATEDTPAQIITLEGNSSEQVEYRIYDLHNATIIGYGEMPLGSTVILSYQGEDFTVTTTFGVDAGIPATAELQVEEILPGTQAYDNYYTQAIDTMVGQGSLESRESVDVSFARFFDIHFLVDGESVEPTDNVDIRIHYHDPITRAEDENGVAVHFADSGIEILNAQVSEENQDPGQVDTFQFTQNSFSVTGTMLLATDSTIATATRVNFNTLDGSGNTRYVIYTYLNGVGYYAFQCIDSNGTVQAVPVNVNNDGTITWTANAHNSGMFWTFSKQAGDNEYLIANSGFSRYMHTTGSQLTTSGTWNSFLVPNGAAADASFKVRSNSSYARIYSPSWGQIVFAATQDANQAANYYIAKVQSTTGHVWFDGTHGGIMSLYGSDNIGQTHAVGTTITLPTQWKSPSKYDYKVAGWYEIYTNTYYAPGAEFVVQENAVFYPDWVAQTYDVGIEDEHTVASLDTNSFITTYVFDYNSLFNMQSMDLSAFTVSSTAHSETWTLTQKGLVDYGNANTLDFIFIDWDSGGKISMPSNVNGDNSKNYNHSYITQGIIQDTANISGGKNLMDLLFDPNTEVIGKHYLGQGNFLYQYMDTTTENFDGIEGHDGYYYFHSRLNAASYNQSYQNSDGSYGRFYLYDYLERTSDSEKDKGDGEFSDFLPFNSIYANHKGMDIETYADPASGKSGYMFDAKDDGQYSEYANAGTNYWFGFRSDIEFYLPNDSGTMDEYGNYGNISTRGKHMVFEFHGDDDVWVYVDGSLMLDLGGVHGIEYGQIDFSTGIVTYYTGENETKVTKTFEQILGPGKNITEGTHTMQFYYMERGGSQSNASIYFNIAPRYDLEIRKEDQASASALNGTVFGIYSDEACTVPAELWNSAAEHEQDMKDGVVNCATNLFTVTDGYARAWGVSAGKTYYIREEQPPVGYPITDDLIRITLNNRGTATIETTTLHGADGEITFGFEVIESDVNNTLKIVSLTVTNQKETRTTDYRVQKDWHQDATNIPASIQVYLTQDGVRYGRTATLSSANGWTYTWTGLPEYHEDGVTKYVYGAEEILVPGYSTSYAAPQEVVEYVDWLTYPKMEDSITYVLTHGGKALSWTGTAFAWESIEWAESEEGLAAQWTVTTNHEGFRLTNGNGWSIAYDKKAKRFVAVGSTNAANNEVLYFAAGRMMAQQDDVYHYFGNLGASEATFANGLVFEMLRKEVMTGTLLNILNTPVKEEEQTHIEVTKVWADDKDHSGDEVTIKLMVMDRTTGTYKETGRTVKLNQKNNWYGTFEDLPYYDGEYTGMPAIYMVEEVAYGSYVPNYSEGTEVAGRPFTAWENINQLQTDNILRFVNAAKTVSVDSGGNLVLKDNDLSDSSQQWKVVSSGGKFYLQNVYNGQYIKAEQGGVYTVSQVRNASAATLNNGSLQLGNFYLDLSTGEISLTTYSSNGTRFSVSRQVTASQMPGMAYTVTNRYAVYNLPETGGAGTNSFYRLGLLLILAAAMIYICNPNPMQRRRDAR